MRYFSIKAESCQAKSAKSVRFSGGLQYLLQSRIIGKTNTLFCGTVRSRSQAEYGLQRGRSNHRRQSKKGANQRRFYHASWLLFHLSVVLCLTTCSAHFVAMADTKCFCRIVSNTDTICGSFCKMDFRDPKYRRFPTNFTAFFRHCAQNGTALRRRHRCCGRSGSLPRRQGAVQPMHRPVPRYGLPAASDPASGHSWPPRSVR